MDLCQHPGRDQMKLIERLELILAFKYADGIFLAYFSENRSRRPLQTPYEIAAKSVIPAIRGMIAKSLIDLNMTQSEIAYFLGITQPAVSKYFSDKRGKAIDFDSRADILKRTNLIAEGISEHRLNRVQIANMIKEVCDYAMRSGYMCELHYGIDPQTKEMNCKMCMEAPASVN